MFMFLLLKDLEKKKERKKHKKIISPKRLQFPRGNMTRKWMLQFGKKSSLANFAAEATK